MTAASPEMGHATPPRPAAGDGPGCWPGATAYADAIQHPEIALDHEDLRLATPHAGFMGLPWSAAGQAAIVFRLAVPGRPDPLALRCFTRDPGPAAERYAAVAASASGIDGWPLLETRWLRRGVRAEDTWWPVVTMPFVRGAQLQAAVKARLEEPHRLLLLAQRWRSLCEDLRRKRIAHGDLQHGNVLVDDDDHLHLVDYDEVWTPATAHLHPGESGHRNYQHPQRLAEGTWDETIDTFSALVVYTSLVVLAEHPELWHFNTGDNLIFTSGDFERPGATPLWSSLFAAGAARAATTALLQRCRTAPDAASLDDVLEGRAARTPAAGAASSPPAKGAPSALPARTAWWNGAPVASQGPTPPPPSTGPVPGGQHPSTPPPPLQPPPLPAAGQAATAGDWASFTTVLDRSTSAAASLPGGRQSRGALWWSAVAVWAIAAVMLSVFLVTLLTQSGQD